MSPPCRHLSACGLSLSALGLGCAPFGGDGWGGQDDAESVAAMEACSAHGISHLDTAAHYGSGKSERVVGSWLQGRRGDVVLASKAFPLEVSAEYMLQQVDESRRRLGVEVIDIFYMHWPRANRDLRPLMEGLTQARESGAIRAIGVSNFSVEQMEQVSTVGRIDVHQMCYNPLWRIAERDILPYCIEHGIGVVTYATLAFGILTGKYSTLPVFGDGDFRPGTVFFDPKLWPAVSAAVQRLRDVWAPTGRPLGHLAILWTIARPGVVSALVGARNAYQVAQAAGGIEGDLSLEVAATVDEVGERLQRTLPDTGNVFRFYP